MEELNIVMYVCKYLCVDMIKIHKKKDDLLFDVLLKHRFLKHSFWGTFYLASKSTPIHLFFFKPLFLTMVIYYSMIKPRSKSQSSKYSSMHRCKLYYSANITTFHFTHTQIHVNTCLCKMNRTRIDKNDGSKCC